MRVDLLPWQQITKSLSRRPDTALAQNEAHDAGSQGSPMEEDSSHSGGYGDNDNESIETILESRTTVAALNDASDTENQTYPTSQSHLLSIDGKIDRIHPARGALSSVSLASVHNGADDAVRQVSPMDHNSPLRQVPPRSGHQGSIEGSPMSQCYSRSNSLFDDQSDIIGTSPLSHSSKTAQNDARDAVNQTSPKNHISPNGQGSPMDQNSSCSNYGSNDSSHLVVTPHSSCSSSASQENVRDAGCQTFPSERPPQEDHFNGIPSYAAEALRNTIKISLSTLCSDFMATAHSDLPRARRDLDDLKEIANQYFSTTESSFDIIHDRTDSWITVFTYS